MPLETADIDGGSAVLVPVGLFMFAWTTFPWVHWMVPIVGSGIFGMG